MHSAGAFIAGAALPPPPSPAAGGSAAAGHHSPGGAFVAGAAAPPAAAAAPAAPVTAGMVDIAVVYDGTGSMKRYCDAMRQAVQAVTDKMATKARPLGADIKWAAVGYKDFVRTAPPPKQGVLCSEIVQNFADAAALNSSLESYVFDGGDDNCEDVYSGLAMARKLKWRPQSTRAVILILDAPPHGVGGLLEGLRSDPAFREDAEDYFKQGSPTGFSVMDAVDDLVSSIGVVSIFVVWCYNRAQSPLNIKFATACQQFMYPAPKASSDGTTPPGFFTLCSTNVEAVSDALSGMLGSVCLAAIAARAPDAATAERSIVTSLKSSEAGAVSVPARNSRTATVAATDTQEIRALVARHLQTIGGSALVSKRSAELGLLSPTMLELVYAADGPVTVRQGMYGEVYRGKLANADGKEPTDVVVKAVQVQFETTKEPETGRVIEAPCAIDLEELKSLLAMSRSGRKGLVKFRGWTRASEATKSRLPALAAGYKWILLVMDYYVSDLETALRERRFSDSVLLTIAKDIISGLYFIHKEERALRALGVSDVFVTAEGTAAIAELGMITKLDFGQPKFSGSAKGVVDPEAQSHDMVLCAEVMRAIKLAMRSPPPVMDAIISSCQSGVKSKGVLGLFPR